MLEENKQWLHQKIVQNRGPLYQRKCTMYSSADPRPVTLRHGLEVSMGQDRGH